MSRAKSNMTPIQVYCRLKPSIDLIKYEIIPNKNQLMYFNNNKLETFRFKKIFDDYTSQSSVFKHVAVPILDKYLSGTNGTIFAYGQTGSGKSHTIFGSRGDEGIVPRSLKYLFDNKLSIQSTDECNILFSMAYFEIYNETVYDLLPSPKRSQKSNVNFNSLLPTNTVSFTVNKRGDVTFKNLNIIRVKNVSQAFKQLICGNKRRQIASTWMNNKSSRSHCICRIEYRTTMEETKSNKTVLNLVDLAGSECISKINNDKQTITESRHINLSLMHLQQVINCLSSPVKPTYVPYRNSTITRLLKGSLGYNCATAMITTIELNQRSIVESTSTCKYARDVSGIKPIIVESVIQKRKVAKKVAKKVDKIGDDKGHSVNCETQTVVLNNNVPANGVIIDKEYDDNSDQAVVIMNENCGDQNMSKVNVHDSQPALKILVINIRAVHDVMRPRLMEAGDGVGDIWKTSKVCLISDNEGHSVCDDKHTTSYETQTMVVNCSNVPEVGVIADEKCGENSGLEVVLIDDENSANQTTNVDLIGHDVGHSVRHDNYVTNCETQTVAVNRDVGVMSVMTDIQCDGVTSSNCQITKVETTMDDNITLMGDSRRCRFRVNFAHINCLLLFAIMMLIFTHMWTNEPDVNSVRFKNAIVNPQQYLKPNLVICVAVSLPTLGGPERPYEDVGKPECYFRNYKYYSNIYAKTVQQNDQIEDKGYNIYCYIVIIILTSLLLWKLKLDSIRLDESTMC